MEHAVIDGLILTIFVIFLSYIIVAVGDCISDLIYNPKNNWKDNKFRKLYFSGQIYHALAYADKHHIPIHVFTYYQDPKLQIENNELLMHLTNYFRLLHDQYGLDWQSHTNLLKSWEKTAHYHCCIKQRICSDHTCYKYFQYIRVQAVQDGKDVLDLLNELQNYKEE